MKTEYNWLEETVCPNEGRTVERINKPERPSGSVEVCLKQDVWDGDGSDFGYAYIDPKALTLPTHFDNGRKVPVRFHKEVKGI
jgi:hypothetical protein